MVRTETSSTKIDSGKILTGQWHVKSGDMIMHNKDEVFVFCYVILSKFSIKYKEDEIKDYNFPFFTPRK